LDNGGLTAWLKVFLVMGSWSVFLLPIVIASFAACGSTSPPPAQTHTQTVTVTPSPQAVPPLSSVPASPDAGPNFYREMSRMGFTPSPDDVKLAQFVCQQMDSERGPSPIGAGINIVFANAANNLTKNQIYGLARAAILNYCPKYTNDFYRAVEIQKIALP
jgi:hypothetical protein